MRKSPILWSLLAASLALNLWLVLRGWALEPPRIPPGKTWLDLPWQVITGLVGGLFALWTYVNAKQQRDRQFEAQTLDARFSDVLAKLAEKEGPQVRSAAATRLTALALTRPVFPESDREIDLHPFFEVAGHQFLTALVLEPEPSLRRHYQEQLYHLIEFGTEAGARDLALTARRMARASTERLASQSRRCDPAFVEASLKEAFGDTFPDPVRAFTSLLGFYSHSARRYDPGWRQHVGHDHDAQFVKEAFESRILNDSALQLFSVAEEVRGIRLSYDFSFAVAPILTFTDFAERPIQITDCALDSLTIDDSTLPEGQGATDASVIFSYVNRLDLALTGPARVLLKSCDIETLSFLDHPVKVENITVTDCSIGSLDVTKIESEGVRKSVVELFGPFMKSR